MDGQGAIDGDGVEILFLGFYNGGANSMSSRYFRIPYSKLNLPVVPGIDHRTCTGQWQRLLG